MKVTLEWLKKYIDFDYSADELAHHLTMLGLEVDSINQIDYQFDNVIIGQIESIEKHQHKPQLSICHVQVGSQRVSLVCGAPNVIPGMKVPVALTGAKLPHDITISAANIHGYKSQGMICSEAELGLSSQNDVIMELPENAPIGQDLKRYLGSGETVIEIDVTPNRPDCLGVFGIAREIAALIDSKIARPEIHLKESASLKIEDCIQVDIQNPESCPRYTARYIQGVKIGPSPRWLIQKLQAVGIRSINNVVDITNFVMMETGQPLHAFDYDLLQDQKIIVKHATEGEKFVTLDDKEHTLTSERLLICDGKKAIALAGVMGGVNSEISSESRNILLESALFNPTNIRRTSKALDLSTDSSKRFERGVDPEGMVYALNRAAELVCELAGGELAKGYIDSYPVQIPTRKIALSIDRTNHVLGTSLDKATIEKLLNRLEFITTAKDNDRFDVDVPTFRVDIEREIDLIEEISRLYGFDKIDSRIYSQLPLTLQQDPGEKFRQLVRDFIVRLGYNEITTLSLIAEAHAKKFTIYRPVKLKNPISEEMGTLRTSIVPGALQIIKWNKNRKIKSQNLFEVGNIFYFNSKQNDAHREVTKIALLKTGSVRSNNWIESSRETTFFDIKGDALSLLRQLNLNHFKMRAATVEFLDREQSVEILISENIVGYLGALSNKIQTEFDIEDTVYVAEFDLNALYQNYNWEKISQPVSKFPAVIRDIAVVVDQKLTTEKVEDVIWRAAGSYLQKLILFDVYRGKQIAADKKSFAFTLTFQSDQKTLTEQEVESNIQNILHALKTKLNAHLRA